MDATRPCPKDDILSAYIDGSLSEPLEARIRTHLESCSICRDELEGLMMMDRLMGELPDIEPSSGFDRAFWQKVSEKETQPDRFSFIKTFFFGWRPYLATAATALIVLGGVVFYESRKGLSVEEIVIAENMDLLQEYDLISRLDLLENWEVIVDTGTES